MHRRRSRRVFGGGRYAALGEELTHQVQAGEIRPHELLELRAGQEHEPSRCLQQDERRSLRKPGPLSQVGRYNQPSPVTHRYLVRPTHGITVPLAEVMWYGSPLPRPERAHREPITVDQDFAVRMLVRPAHRPRCQASTAKPPPTGRGFAL